jgi:hypothetical protein
MKKYFSFAKSPICQEPCVITLGMFDGVHQGHQYLLNQAQEIASRRDAQLVTFTFRELPKAKDSLIITPYHKNILLEQMGVDILVELDFSDEIKHLSPREFLDRVETMFPVSSWVVGEDFRFGLARSGDIAFLRQNVQGHVDVIEHYFRNEFSSTKIRENIRMGSLSKVSLLLGRTYSIMGKAKALDTPQEGEFQLPSLVSAKTVLTLDAKEICLPGLGEWHALVRLGEEYHDLPATCSISAEKACCLTLPEKLVLPNTLFPEVILLSKAEK